jgi:hypothetical protein
MYILVRSIWEWIFGSAWSTYYILPTLLKKCEEAVLLGGELDSAFCGRASECLLEVAAVQNSCSDAWPSGQHGSDNGPFVQPRLVSLHRVEAWAAIIATECVEIPINFNHLMRRPKKYYFCIKINEQKILFFSKSSQKLLD